MPNPVPGEFPVLMSPRERRLNPAAPASVPWGLVAPYGVYAERNHGGQTLAELAARGGLDPVELWAVLNRREYPTAEFRGNPALMMAQAIKDVDAAARRYRQAARGAVAVPLRPGWWWACPFCGHVGAARRADATPGAARPGLVECPFCRVHYRAEYPDDAPTPPQPAAGGTDEHDTDTTGGDPPPDVPRHAGDAPPGADHDGPDERGDVRHDRPATELLPGLRPAGGSEAV